MALFELLYEKTVKIPLKSKNKNDVIKELVKILKSSGNIKNSKSILAEVMNRESSASTGLGEGIAIPHAKTSAVEKVTVALGVSPKGIDFESLDNQPAKIFFLILSPPDKTSEHLQVLTMIAKLNRNKDFCRELLEAKSSAEILKLFKREQY